MAVIVPLSLRSSMPVVSALTVGGRFPNRREKEKANQRKRKKKKMVQSLFHSLGCCSQPTFTYFHPLLSLVPRVRSQYNSSRGERHRKRGEERKKKFWKTFRFPAERNRERETQTADIFIRFKCRVWRRTEEEEEEKEAAECWQFNETSSPSCGIDCCCLGVLGPRV